MAQYKPPPRLFGADFTESEIAEARRGNRLLMLSLGVTNRCNLKCDYCFTDAGCEPDGLLTLEDYKEVLLQAKDLGLRTVVIYGPGEPFLFDKLASLTDFIVSEGLKLIIFTNGTLIDDDWAVYLSDKPVAIVGTINSLDRTLQDNMLRVPGAFDEIHAALNRLLKAGLADGQPTKIGTDTFITTQNVNEIPTIFRWCRDRNIFPFITRMFHLGRANRLDTDITNGEFGDVVNQLLLIDNEEYGYTWEPHPPYAGARCTNLFYNILVDLDGKVRPCYGLYYELGDIRVNSLKDIWFSEDAVKFQNIDKYLAGKCKTCESNRICYGCPCRTYGLTRNVFVEDAICWR